MSYPRYKLFLILYDIIISSLYFIFIFKYYEKEQASFYIFIATATLALINIVSNKVLLYYRRKIVFNFYYSMLSSFFSTLITASALVTFLILFQYYVPPRQICIIVTIYIVYIFVLRVVISPHIIRANMIRGLNFDNVVIIGTGDESRLLAARLIYDNDIDSRLVGFIGEKISANHDIFGTYPVLCRLDDLKSTIIKYRIRIVYIADNSLTPNELLEIVNKLKEINVNIKLSSNLLFSGVGNLFGSDRISDYTVYKINSHFSSAFYLLAKRIVDINLSLLGLLILSPFLIVIGILIKLSSPGPIVFAQQRVGKNGDIFSFYKFRSMLIGSDQDETRKKEAVDAIRNNSGDTKNSTKIVNQVNVTKIGRILRKYSLDELPQLYNVLLGDMSLVGPRPPIPYEVEAYKAWHKKRFTVKPGCTGLWQILGRSKTNFDDMVALDLYYIMNASITMDIMIVLKTLPVMVYGDGGE